MRCQVWIALLRERRVGLAWFESRGLQGYLKGNFSSLYTEVRFDLERASSKDGFISYLGTETV